MAGFVGNKYYNNPQLGAAFGNLARAFGPPSPAESTAYLRAQIMRAEDERKRKLYEVGKTPSESAALTGVQSYGQTPQGFNYKVDTDAATSRYGYDQSRAGTEYTADRGLEGTRYKADQGLKGDMFGTLYDALDPGQVRPPVPVDEAAMFGLDGAIAPAEGIPAPLSTDEWKALNLQRQMVNGDLTDEMLLGMALGDQTVLTQTPDGPAYMNPGQAAATGAPAYVNKGAEAKPETANWASPDGRSGTAVFRNGQWVDTQTGTPIPSGSTTFNAQAQGPRGDVTGTTTANVTRADATRAEAEYGLQRSAQFRQLLNDNPGIMGVTGMVRGFAQDLVAAADEAAAAYGGDNVISSVEEVRALAQQAGARGGYDPAFAQAAALALEMAYLQAKMQDPGGEVNVRELERLLSVYDGGLAGNPKVLASLDVLDRQLHDRIGYSDNLKQGGGAPAQTGPAVGAIEDGHRFLGGDPADPNSWEAVQ